MWHGIKSAVDEGMNQFLNNPKVGAVVAGSTFASSYLEHLDENLALIAKVLGILLSSVLIVKYLLESIKTWREINKD